MSGNKAGTTIHERAAAFDASGQEELYELALLYREEFGRDPWREALELEDVRAALDDDLGQPGAKLFVARDGAGHAIGASWGFEIAARPNDDGVMTTTGLAEVVYPAETERQIRDEFCRKLGGLGVASFYYLMDVVVAQHMQDRGVGTELHERVVSHAARQGMVYVAHAHRGNASAHLLEKAGATQIMGVDAHGVALEGDIADDEVPQRVVFVKYPPG